MKSGEKMEKEETVIDETINAQLPTTEPILKKQEDEFHSFGRRIIYADYTEDELDAPTIAKILNDSFWIHMQNANEINYLENYYYSSEVEHYHFAFENYLVH